MGNLYINLSIPEDKLKPYTWKDFQLDVKNVLPTSRDIYASYDNEAINNGINNIFLFNRGERIINPEFGNSLYKYLYEPITEDTAQLLGEEIKRLIKRWEPRIVVDGIIIAPMDDNPDTNTYQVTIKYHIPSLNAQNLSFKTAINARR